MEALTERAAEIVLISFLAITFGQSSLDKILDWDGNLGWLKSHFAESPLKPVVPALFFILTVTELSAGVLSVLGLVQVIRGAGDDLAFWSAAISCLALPPSIKNPDQMIRVSYSYVWGLLLIRCVQELQHLLCYICSFFPVEDAPTFSTGKDKTIPVGFPKFLDRLSHFPGARHCCHR